ncbi:hypothetical protein NQ317_013180 [Molorchus minor]|uniref:Uncharacterized protein n=1 Tax=Molorchus minor TaxID=1323400 RepID=A0ABQ9J731_9CUCU|nr:hypothetical protein NQ317_013180 [Molorchus minor]
MYNPIIYCWMNARKKKAVKILQRLFCTKSKVSLKSGAEFLGNIRYGSSNSQINSWSLGTICYSLRASEIVFWKKYLSVFVHLQFKFYKNVGVARYELYFPHLNKTFLRIEYRHTNSTPRQHVSSRRLTICNVLQIMHTSANCLLIEYAAYRKFRHGFKQFFAWLPFVHVSPGALTRREVMTSKRRSYSGSPDHNRIIRNVEC